MYAEFVCTQILKLRRHEAIHIRSGFICCGKCRMKFDSMEDLRNHDPYCQNRFGFPQEAIPQEGTENWLRRQRNVCRKSAKEQAKRFRDEDRKYERADRNKKKCFFCCMKFRLAEYYSHSMACSKRRGRSDTWDQKKGQIPQTHQVVRYRKRKYNQIGR